MGNHDMEHTWRNSNLRLPDGGETDLMRAVSALAKRTRRRNLLTAAAFVVVILAMAYFVRQMQFHHPMTIIGIALAGLSMLGILILKWYRQAGLYPQSMNTSSVNFLRVAHRRLRFSGWLIRFGILVYIGLFALGFAMTLPEMLAGVSPEVQFLVGLIGFGYLIFIAVQGRARARREYDRDVRPVIARIESLMTQFE